ncbi:MAG: nitrite/sulfite reductase [SAR202 cluster bacterium]|nr:nitrite/sulfite reductase [SAR202 cluster bacterium]MQG87130.1 nitrite/sulfite reductase [SAR202 cluster bacterium]|tara:strand:- start:3152 stop:4990 length:1839 start_codon:yes stop_codon:yes gene_type:complete
MTNIQIETDQGAIHSQSLESSKKARGIIPFSDEEVVRFEAESKKYSDGEQDNLEFTPFRLKQGIYGQRQPDVQMIRIKLPGGIITAEAMDVMATISETYAPLHKGHITTRENIQFHHIPLSDCPDVMRLLGTVGLSSREACGNTVRNVVGDAIAGVADDEIFDPTPYLAAYVRFGVRHPITQSFPRKFKTAFTGTDKQDRVAAAIQDLTYVSQIRVVDGKEERGFKVFVGGGTSIMPRLAKPLFDFLPEKDYLRLALAIWTVFNQATSLRKNRMMARLKVLIDRIGLDEFKVLVDEQLELIGEIDFKPYVGLDSSLDENAGNTNFEDISSEVRNSAEYQKWHKYNVSTQKQEGYNLVYIKPTRGDLDTAQFKALAEIIRKYTGGQARAMQEQNMVLRWVSDLALPHVWKALKDIGLAEYGAHTILNVVSCPGTDSCKLGITSSMGLNKAIKEELDTWDSLIEDEDVQKIRIKMSGCPNGCGLHHIANIGFHGAAIKGPDGQQVPAYEVFLGGNYGGPSVEESRIGARIPKVKIPAKLAPNVLKQMVSYYKDNKQSGELFNKFVDRVGTGKFEELAKAAQEQGETAAGNSDLIMDWERTNLYKVERGEGECAV